MTCMTWLSPSRSSCWMRLPSAVHHASRRFDARTAGAHAGFGGGVVDSARRRPGPLRAGGAVPGVPGLDREVAEHGEGLRPLMPTSALMGSCRPPGYAVLPLMVLVRAVSCRFMIGITVRWCHKLSRKANRLSGGL